MARQAASKPTHTAAPGASEERARSKKIGVLASLWPFMKPYKFLMIGATLALILTASMTLTLPLAVRRVVICLRPR